MCLLLCGVFLFGATCCLPWSRVPLARGVLWGVALREDFAGAWRHSGKLGGIPDAALGAEAWASFILDRPKAWRSRAPHGVKRTPTVAPSCARPCWPGCQPSFCCECESMCLAWPRFRAILANVHRVSHDAARCAVGHVVCNACVAMCHARTRL